MKSSRTTISSRTRSQTDVVSFANIRYGNNTQEWLEDVAFVTGTMCDPNEPQNISTAGGIQIKLQEKNGMKQ